MIAKTLIHIVALAAGVAIIVCVTLVATYLRENAAMNSDAILNVIQCYDCTDKHCINMKNAVVQDCNGVCLKALAPMDKLRPQSLKAIQVCYRKAFNGDSCPIDYLERLTVVRCSICRTDLCNRIDDHDLFFEDSDEDRS